MISFFFFFRWANRRSKHERVFASIEYYSNPYADCWSILIFILFIIQIFISFISSSAPINAIHFLWKINVFYPYKNICCELDFVLGFVRLNEHWTTIMEHFRAGHTDQTVHFPIFLIFFVLMLSERNLLAYIISFYRVSIKWNYTFSRSNVRREWQTLAFN